VPFKLDSQATRIAETHVHEALREALVNTLIHADHQSSRPIVRSRRNPATRSRHIPATWRGAQGRLEAPC
jgi:hypothetical protein